MNNPWITRYSSLSSVEEIEKRSAVWGQPYEPAEIETVGGGGDRLRKALSKVFVPTPQTNTAILRELERAAEHARVHYSDGVKSLAKFYESFDPDEDEDTLPTIFSGLSGCGKSHIRKALMRILGEGRLLELGDKHVFPTKPYLVVRVNSHTTEAGLLTPLARPEIATEAVRVKARNLAQECRRWMLQSGVCEFGVDELQFLTQSATASALVSKALLSYCSLRVPWHVNMNYSLGWKLVRRNHEVTRRLHGRVRIIVPDAPDSSEWTKYLNEWAIVCQKISSFDLTRQAEALWNMTAGIKGELRQLIVLAYERCLERGARAINWADIISARASASFQSSRNNIDALINHAVTGAALPEHLRCPFTEESVVLSIKDYERSLRMARQERVAVSEIRSAATAIERKAMDAAMSILTRSPTGNANAVTGKDGVAEVVPLRQVSKRKAPLTAKSLLDGARLANQARQRAQQDPPK